MPFTSIIMPYKENCKVEGEIMTKFKIARNYFSNNYQQKDIAYSIKCHKNTVYSIIKKCRNKDPNDEIWKYLNNNINISEEKLNTIFNFLKGNTKKPNNCQIGFKKNSTEEKLIIEKFKNSKKLPKYQWTIIDAKTRIRFLAWSYERCSFFGFKFLEYTICWLRAHNILEAQFWIIYFNNRSHNGISMNGLLPKQKLEKLEIINAKKICNFPCLILDDFFKQFQSFFNIEICQKKFQQNLNRKMC